MTHEDFQIWLRITARWPIFTLWSNSATLDHRDFKLMLTLTRDGIPYWAPKA